MQLLQCPICKCKNLIPAPVGGERQGSIICINENYVHFNVGILEYLAHTEESEREERRKPKTDLAIHVERDNLVLN
jgi:hypothetical protein